MNPRTNEAVGAFSTSRRSTLKKLGGLGAAAMLPFPAAHAASSLKIGFVSPQTGPLAVFAEPDAFILQQVRKVLEGGVTLAGRKYPVEVIYKDTQSSSNRAADVTAELILKDEVDIVVAASTPATTNPVADQCELNGVPCITNGTPWQPYFFGRGGKPDKGFEWTWHYFWGLEDVIGMYTHLWEQLPTNKVLGALWPNDSDGNAWGDPKMGFPPVLAQKGYTLVDPGRYQTPSDNFSSYIAAFKEKGVGIVTGVVPPPDFANFWAQAIRQDLRPTIVTVAKACQHNGTVKSYGRRAAGLSLELWWSPSFPFTSSLTGQSAAELAQAFTTFSGVPWNMPLGLNHSLFELAVDAFKRAADRSPAAIRDAVRSTHLNTVAGPIDFSSGPVPNICKTVLAGGQWKWRNKALELLLVDNSHAQGVALQDQFEPIQYT